MLPALQVLGQRYDEVSIAGLEDEIVRSLPISSEDRERMLPSGKQTVFANRLNWARSYLSKAALIELPRRGFCRATDRGRELLAMGVNEIDLRVLERYPEFSAWHSQQKADWEVEHNSARENPVDLIASSFEFLNSELAREIVERVHAFTPAFFDA